jgi:hypothetical protein
MAGCYQQFDPDEEDFAPALLMLSVPQLSLA